MEINTLDDENHPIELFVMQVYDYITMAFSIIVILVALIIVIRFRKDESLMYRSPNLLIVSISSMLASQLIIWIGSVSLFGDGHLNCITGHIEQYIFYPFFFLSYMTRALRLIILFKRADIGLYSSESIVKKNDESNTIALLKENENTLTGSINSSDIKKPEATMLHHKMYYWLLWFDTEWEYFMLTSFITLLSAIIMTIFLCVKMNQVLPVINSSYCLYVEQTTSSFTTTLLDIIIRNCDLYGIATTYVLLMRVPQDFNIKTEVRRLLLCLGTAGVARSIVGIAYFNDPATKIHKINRGSFYIQMITFTVACLISVFIPFLTTKRLTPSLPSPPERIEYIQTAILDPKGFSCFYEWCEKYSPSVVKYFDCFVRIRFFKKAFDNLEMAEEVAEKATDIFENHLDSDSEDRLSLNSAIPDIDNITSDMFDPLQSQCLSILTPIYDEYKKSDEFHYLYQQLCLEVKQYIILKNRIIP
ncbi:unnamed protein product [Moneuplotes crassus]|uniref:Uncharacterized protein n=1 Tax=Euplotes crassus TaxID=5936 RepID=A0AAD1UF32_EUPCR|nr:unnamed protein product [Moneuplotes crassus]